MIANRTAALVMAILMATEFNSPTPALSAGGGGFLFGGSRFDLDDLETALAAGGFGPLGSSDFSAGVAVYKLVNDRIIIGGEIQRAAQTVFNESSEATVDVGHAMFDVGYVVYDRSSLRVFPLLGIGSGGVGLKIVERAATPTFDEVLQRPHRESTMRTGGLLVQAAVGADYFLKLGRRRAGGGSGLLFGLRLGFLYDPTEASWNMEERKVLGGPDVKSTGPFIRFLLGWGRFDD